MKFKLESNSTVQDLVVEDIASVEALMNTLDTSSLDQAFEELNDLQMLQQNIEKFGITEPVMDLVGGTLQSMNIRIDDKDACLEGLGEAIKNAGSAIYEFVKKIIDKIIGFIKSVLDKFTGKKLKDAENKISNIKNAGVGVDLFGIPNQMIMDKLCASVEFLPMASPEDTSRGRMTKLEPCVLVKTDAGYELDSSIEASMNERGDFKAKGYHSARVVVHYGGRLALWLHEAQETIEGFRKRLEFEEKHQNDPDRLPPDAQEKYLAYLRAFIPALNKMVQVYTMIYIRILYYADAIMFKIDSETTNRV